MRLNEYFKEHDKVKTSDIVHLCNKQSPLAQSKWCTKLINIRNAYQFNVTYITTIRLLWNAMADLSGANTLCFVRMCYVVCYSFIRF